MICLFVRKISLGYDKCVENIFHCFCTSLVRVHLSRYQTFIYLARERERERERGIILDFSSSVCVFEDILVDIS
jgi:hypothetical protein